MKLVTKKTSEVWDLDAVRPCIVSQTEDTITVDIESKCYQALLRGEVVGDDTPGTRFFDTLVCKSQANCELCRHPEKGRKWRKTQLKLYPIEETTTADFKCPYKKPWMYRTPRHGHLKLGQLQECVIIENRQGFGDAIMLSGAIRDLQKQYPGRFNIGVRCPSWGEVFWHNPYIEGGNGYTKPKHISVNCWAGSYGNDSGHLLFEFHRRLGDALGLVIKPTRLAGDIHFNDTEKNEKPKIDEPYWLVFPRGYTSEKFYDPGDMQKIKDGLRGRIRLVSTEELGHLKLRELFQLVYHAEGVISPISAGMHLAAAVPVKHGMPERRACVVFAGGREPPNYISYPGHTYMHVVGQMKCCSSGGCFRHGVGPGGNCVDWAKQESGHDIAACMKHPALAPDRMIEAILAHQAIIDEHKCRHAAKLEKQRQNYLQLVVLAEQNKDVCFGCSEFARWDGELSVICKQGKKTCGCKDGGRIALAPEFQCPLGKTREIHGE